MADASTPLYPPGRAGCSHRFIFLRQDSRENGWRNFVTVDIFYCKRCLHYAEKEVPKKQEFRG